MRAAQWLLLAIGLTCLGVYGLFSLQAYLEQSELESEFARQQLEFRGPGTVVQIKPGVRAPAPRLVVEGDLVGRLEIPRLNLSVMVMEGTGDRTLRLGAGHIIGTSFPGAPGNA